MASSPVPFYLLWWSFVADSFYMLNACGGDFSACVTCSDCGLALCGRGITISRCRSESKASDETLASDTKYDVLRSIDLIRSLDVLPTWNGLNISCAEQPIDAPSRTHLFQPIQFPCTFVTSFTNPPRFPHVHTSINIYSSSPSPPSPLWPLPPPSHPPPTCACQPSSCSNTVITMTSFGTMMPRRMFTASGTPHPPVASRTSTPSRLSRVTHLMLLVSTPER